MTDDRLIQRAFDAVAALDLGLSLAVLRTDPLRGINAALREIGGNSLETLDDADALARAVVRLEGEV